MPMRFGRSDLVTGGRLTACLRSSVCRLGGIAGSQLACRLADGRNETFFISGERLALRELVAMVEHKSGGQLKVRLGARPYREREVMKPITGDGKALKGWVPTHSVSDTIDAMLTRVQTHSQPEGDGGGERHTR